jgi:hypothetical protein
MRRCLTFPSASRRRPTRADWARRQSVLCFARLLADLQEVFSLSSSCPECPRAARPAPDLQRVLCVQSAVTVLLTAILDVEQAAVRHAQLQQLLTALCVLAPFSPAFASAVAQILDRERIRYVLWQTRLEDPSTRVWCALQGSAVNGSPAVSIFSCKEDPT